MWHRYENNQTNWWCRIYSPEIDHGVHANLIYIIYLSKKFFNNKHVEKYLTSPLQVTKEMHIKQVKY